MKNYWRLALLGLLLAVIACNVALEPTPTLTPMPPTRTPEPLDTGWQPVSAGLEARRLLVMAGELGDRLWLVRLDPAQARFRVLYDPANPRTVRGWFDAHPVRLAVNAGYFTPEKAATALVVSDGQCSGQSYSGFGGMFSVSGESALVRSLIAHPYLPDEPLDQAVQSFPMLLQSGGLPAIEKDDGKLARRTVIAQDRAGRIVFLVSSLPIFSLKTLSDFLLTSDLDLDVALNLDGGTSSGLWYADPAGRTVGVDSWVNIPAVIVVEAVP
jgi:uncharacterized protein YigE (DUF2233 family)